MSLLSVGIPTELKPGEKRVGLTPRGVKALVSTGVQVWVEAGAGKKSEFFDSDYQKSGAVILPSANEVWAKANIIKKIKEPMSEEFPYLRQNQIIFTYLHLASEHACALLDALVKSKTTAIAYETIVKEGTTPLLKPMSEVAGTLSAYYAAVIQSLRSGGNSDWVNAIENVAKEYPNVPQNYHLKQVKVMVLGGGAAGICAGVMAQKMGAQVTLSERSPHKREHIKNNTPNINCADPNENQYLTLLNQTDVIIAAVHVPGERAKKIINEEQLKLISSHKKKIIIDISIDQGGNIAQSKPVTYLNPVYLDSYGNLRFSVSNMPSLCGKGASLALEEVSLPYLKALTQGLERACVQYPELALGINVKEGLILNEAVRLSHQR